MEFGKILQEDLDHTDFNLPADHADNSSVLPGKPAANPKFYVGCAKWGRKDWVGKIYPEKTKEADFLSHYARHFNSLELNATFYKIPTKAQTSTWSSKVGDDFLFCPKFSQGITHIRRLKNAQEATDRFLDGVSGFGKNLGPLFLMPHPGMGPKTLDSVQQFLEYLPKDIRVFVELRHPDWYTDTNSADSLFKFMQTVQAGAVITDAAGRRDCVHMRLTTPEVFIRFVGNSLHRSDYTRIDAWVQRLCQWLGQGLETVYFFMHQHEEVHSPELCKYLIEKLNQECNAGIPVPQFVS